MDGTAMSTWQNGTQLATWLGFGMLFTDAATRWSGENIVTRVTERVGLDPLTAVEHHHLETWRDGTRGGSRRRGELVTESGQQVAVITAVCLPQRIRDVDVIREIQCTDTPLGFCLRPLNVSRHPLMAEMRACGPFAVESSGVLRLPDGLPVAIAVEQVFRSFAASHRARSSPAGLSTANSV
jgi:hypothetical protein